MLRQRTRTHLAAVLRSWLPLLCASADELDCELAKFAENNPVIKIKKAREGSMPNLHRHSNAAAIEALNMSEQSRYDELELQLNKSLFPTQMSLEIARFIIENLNELGYYEEPENLPYEREQIERIRARFAYLEPSGVGAKDFAEAVRFALLNAEIDDEVFKLACLVASDLENANKYVKEPLYKQAYTAIKRLALPPWLKYAPKSEQISADVIVDISPTNALSVRVADEAYSEVLIDESCDKKYYKEQIRQATNLIDALQLRRATLKKIGLMIIELQYDYFFGGAIVPMKLADIASELDRNASTISRAIANKYLESPRGLIALKEFFCAEVGEEGTSNKEVKDFLLQLIANEDKKKPLSDAAILKIINEKFNLELVRRTITKYRAMLDIKGSSERKKIYELRGLNEL